MDIYSSKKRSKIMSKISGKETKPEIKVRKFLFSQGFRYLKNDRRYPGTPDIVLPKYNSIVFVHGCFWHGHNCKYGDLPETNKKFWENKIGNTIKRDKRNKQKLEKAGWKVIIVWECEINNNENFKSRMKRLITKIREDN